MKSGIILPVLKLPFSFKLSIALVAVCVFLAGAGWLAYHWLRPRSARTVNVIAWINAPQDHADWSIRSRTRCGNAPFLLPTDGFIGYLWNDTFKIGSRHQGIDIFGGGGLDDTPVYAAYSGYLTRLPSWKSSVIIRIPDDPFHPGRQIWTYYTHMANPQGDSYISPDFPPGSNEVYVEAGTLLGHQGNYSGDPGSPTGIHLHFSIVKDDGYGKFLNELDIRNTLDPSPYLGLPLNAGQSGGEIPVCKDSKNG